ncbi:MAG: lipoprotein, partial [Candidatus Margulisiibacteriota bacterium]
MKKIVFFLSALIMVSACSFALPGGTLPYGAGAKFAAMGGAGSALVDDIASAYYNPAGMFRAQAVSLKIGAGAASEGSDKLLAVFGNMSNPAKFLADNYSNALNIKGNLNAFVGLDIAKIGLSVIPVTSLTLSKTANTLSGSIVADLMSDSALTL